MWSSWQGWSTCSKTCGGGRQRKGRIITQNATQVGRECDPHANIEERPCNDQDCYGKT